MASRADIKFDSGHSGMLSCAIVVERCVAAAVAVGERVRAEDTGRAHNPAPRWFVAALEEARAARLAEIGEFVDSMAASAEQLLRNEFIRRCELAIVVRLEEWRNNTLRNDSGAPKPAQSDGKQLVAKITDRAGNTRTVPLFEYLAESEARRAANPPPPDSDSEDDSDDDDEENDTDVTEAAATTREVKRDLEAYRSTALAEIEAERVQLAAMQADVLARSGKTG